MVADGIHKRGLERFRSIGVRDAVALCKAAIEDKASRREGLDVLCYLCSPSSRRRLFALDGMLQLVSRFPKQHAGVITVARAGDGVDAIE